MKKLILIRHGEVPLAWQRRYIGSTNPPLSEEGRAGCRKLREQFSAHNPVKIWCSPLLRAVQSAEEICPGREIAFDHRLREIDFGDWENLSYQEICEVATPSQISTWAENIDEMVFPGGSSVREFNCAVDEFMDELPDEYPVALITHGGVLMRIISRIKGLSPERRLEALLPRGAMEVLNCDLIVSEN